MITSISQLSDLELRILIMLVSGYTRKEIKQELSVSLNTISKAIQDINRRCETNNILVAISKLAKNNII